LLRVWGTSSKRNLSRAQAAEAKLQNSPSTDFFFESLAQRGWWAVKLKNAFGIFGLSYSSANALLREFAFLFLGVRCFASVSSLFSVPASHVEKHACLPDRQAVLK